MSDFSVTSLRTGSVSYLYRLRETIEVDPIYQRQGEVWSTHKRQLLVDSIINSFDVPKIYLHEHPSPVVKDGRRIKYSLVDGRQRLEAIWGFLDGRFPLSDDFVSLEDDSESAAGKNIHELDVDHPDLSAIFRATSLDVMVIRTNEIELIEEMFSRLNEAVPLNAAEKRNGRGGPLRPVVRELVEHEFFTHCLPFSNRRYRHLELATKFIYWADHNGPADSKKQRLDDYWEEFRQGGSDSLSDPEALRLTVERVLDRMRETFSDDDPLLSGIGMVSLYFLLFLSLHELDGVNPRRQALVAFNAARSLRPFDDETQLNQFERRLLEFGTYSQSPNDGAALEFRLGVLREFLSSV